jgi:hypothetical protein
VRENTHHGGSVLAEMCALQDNQDNQNTLTTVTTDPTVSGVST